MHPRGSGTMNLAHRATEAGNTTGGRRREDGATLVEFALILPLLALLLFGIIDFGLTLNDYQALRQGVREGAREGSVNDYPDCGTFASAGTARQIQCAVENRVGKGDADVYVSTVRLSTSITPWEKGNYFLVCAQMRATSFSGFTAPFLNDKWLKSKIKVRIEKDGGSGTGAAEPIPSGTDWSWCT